MPFLHSTSRRARVQRPILLTLFTILVAFVTVAAFVAHALTDIREIKIAKTAGKAVSQSIPDVEAGRSLTFLLVGTDAREGKENLEIGGGDDESARADTTIVVKISADRKRIYMASMPRDALVDIPECELSNGVVVPARRDAMFNTAFGFAWSNGDKSIADGVACAAKTFHEVTGIHLDGVVVADFAGFAKVVNAIGGVNVCLAEPFKPHSVGDFQLPAGESHLNGMEAIQFVRARKGVGDGSDTQRQVRQHYFLRNVWARVEAQGILSNPLKTLELINSVQDMLQFSESISSATTLGGLAYALRNLSMDDIISLRVPFEPEGNRVVLTSDAVKVWEQFMPTTLAEEEAAELAKQQEQQHQQPANTDSATPSEPAQETGSESGQQTPKQPAQEEEEQPKSGSDSDASDDEVAKTPAAPSLPDGSKEHKEEDNLGLLHCPQDH
ncbi:LCP family protein [Boudabousia liubingyangii]|uniref:LCP family protein n=1 Tax=Boudabousia liubingyangii TaxID=1921764 RepID=UPI0009F8EE27|nr:LCP family protein [Boudabousia liubingyangii]